jgi:rSAM/selenodomain-associated transferase 2
LVAASSSPRAATDAPALDPALDGQARISVVLITLNEAAMVGECLARVAAQSREGGVEIVVADGGSVDGTVAAAQRYARVVAAAQRGRAAGLNAGAAAATGEILLFLHADTRLPDGWPALVRRVLAAPGVVGGRFRVSFDNPSWRLRVVAAAINARDRILGGFTGDQAVFVAAGVFRALGGYADLPLMEDLDFARRLVGAGKVVRLRQAVVTSARRWERHGLLRTVALMWTLRLLYRAGVPPRYLAPFYGDAR